MSPRGREEEPVLCTFFFSLLSLATAHTIYSHTRASERETERKSYFLVATKGGVFSLSLPDAAAAALFSYSPARTYIQARTHESSRGENSLELNRHAKAKISVLTGYTHSDRFARQD